MEYPCYGTPMPAVEHPCCVCGKWGKYFKSLDVDILSPVVVRKYICGMLKVKYVCRSCTAECVNCGQMVIGQQRRMFKDKCNRCFKELNKTGNSYKRKEIK